MKKFIVFALSIVFLSLNLTSNIFARSVEQINQGKTILQQCKTSDIKEMKECVKEKIKPLVSMQLKECEKLPENKQQACLIDVYKSQGLADSRGCNICISGCGIFGFVCIANCYVPWPPNPAPCP